VVGWLSPRASFFAAVVLEFSRVPPPNSFLRQLRRFRYGVVLLKDLVPLLSNFFLLAFGRSSFSPAVSCLGKNPVDRPCFEVAGTQKNLHNTPFFGVPFLQWGYPTLFVSVGSRGKPLPGVTKKTLFFLC